MKSILTLALVAVASTGWAGARQAIVPPSGDIDSRSYAATCFGYTGTFKDGSDVMVVDWKDDGSWDECFGIAPSRTIWHIWPGSGGWKQMPNNGRADDIYRLDTDRINHRVTVLVTSSGKLWSSDLDYQLSWQPWYYFGPF